VSAVVDVYELDQAAEAALGVLASGITAAELDKRVFPPLTWAVPGVIPEGLTMLAGAPKAGKSWFVLSAALGIASGGVVLGRVRTHEPRPVLYFALEDGYRRLQGRVRDLLYGEPAPAALSFVIDVQPSQLRPAIEQWLRMNPCGVVILDTLGRVRPAPRPNESPYQADYAVMSALKRLTDDQPGSSFVVVHHTRKAAAGDFLERVSGTQGIAGACDTTLVLSRERGQDGGLLEVTGRDVAEASYALVSQSPGSWQLDGANLTEAANKAGQVKATAGLGDRSADIVAYLQAHPGSGPTEIGRALDIEPNKVGTYLGRLAESDRIARSGRGKYKLSTHPVESVESVETAGQTGGVFSTAVETGPDVSSADSTLSTLSTDPPWEASA
jgi:hypothetical protein